MLHARAQGVLDLVELLQYVVFFCWAWFTVFVILGIVGQIYRPKRSRKKAGNVECVIVSVANRRVERSLFECIAHTKKMLDNHLWLLVDEGSELIPQLKENSLVIVPRSYRRDLIGKGRAINYFIEKEVKPDKWYTFIDDDNLILDDSFLYEIPYYDEMGYVATTPVLMAREGKSTLTYIMDSIRYFDALMMFRFFTGLLKRPLMGFHGEFLTVKGEVLKEIGYNNPSLIEDFRFASELVPRGYKTWQSASRVSIRSPNSLSDLLKQRGRWFKGLLKDWRYYPSLMKGMVFSRLVIWYLWITAGSRLLIGFLWIFGSWALSPLWLFGSPFYYAIPGGLYYWTVYLYIPGGLYYWTVYLYGVVKSKKPYYFFLIPFFGILEASSAYVGLKSQKGFVVIDKN